MIGYVLMTLGLLGVLAFFYIARESGQLSGSWPISMSLVIVVLGLICSLFGTALLMLATVVALPCAWLAFLHREPTLMFSGIWCSTAVGVGIVISPTRPSVTVFCALVGTASLLAQAANVWLWLLPSTERRREHAA